MTDYRNILRLHSQGHSQRELKRELHCSRHTISAVLVQSAAAGITWPLEDGVTNEDIQEILFPGKYAYASPYAVPDLRYIHEELAKKVSVNSGRDPFFQPCRMQERYEAALL